MVGHEPDGLQEDFARLVHGELAIFALAPAFQVVDEVLEGPDVGVVHFGPFASLRAS